MAAIPKILQRMARQRRPIIVGPWLSEVGFELLYWIPFLNWVKTYRPFDPERMVRRVARRRRRLVSEHHARTTSTCSTSTRPSSSGRRTTERLQENKQKHLALTDFDREILKVAYQHIGSKECRTAAPDVHVPALLRRTGRASMSIELVDEFASFERLPALDTSDVAGELPRDFTAVRFYFNESFPDNEENKLFVTRLLQTLTEAGDVVLLNPDLHIDDHWDMTIRDEPRAFTASIT